MKKRIFTSILAIFLAIFALWSWAFLIHSRFSYTLALIMIIAELALITWAVHENKAKGNVRLTYKKSDFFKFCLSLALCISIPAFTINTIFGLDSFDLLFYGFLYISAFLSIFTLFNFNIKLELDRLLFIGKEDPLFIGRFIHKIHLKGEKIMKKKHTKTYLLGFVVLFIVAVICFSAYNHWSAIQNGAREGWESVK